MKNYNIDTCDIYVAQKILKSKWVVVILHALKDSDKTFNQLLAVVCFISNTQLSKALAQLKEQDIIMLAPDNYYKLTKKGQDLYSVTKMMQEWSQKYP